MVVGTHNVDVHGAGLGAATLQPVVLGEFQSGSGVFDEAGPEFGGVVGGGGSEEGEGVD